MSSDYDLDKATEDLGEHWELPMNGLKPYACGVVNHPLIDAMIALREREGVSPRPGGKHRSPGASFGAGVGQPA